MICLNQANMPSCLAAYFKQLIIVSGFKLIKEVSFFIGRGGGGFGNFSSFVNF